MKNSAKRIGFLSFILVFIIPIFFTFIHEISHVITALMFGNPLVEVVFKNKIEKNIFTFGVGVIFNIINEKGILWMSISGSIGTIIVCIPVLILAIKKRNILFAFIGAIFVLKEFTYWTIGSYYNLGDPYVLFWALENQFNISINTFNFYLFFLISTIVVYGLFMVFINRVWILKGGLKGW